MMDPDSPVAVVERTFWAVWNYITEAVNRFLRPEPTDTVLSDPDSIQDSSANSEPTGSAKDGGEQPLAPAPLVRSSAVVGWEARRPSKAQQREDAEGNASEEREEGNTGSDDGEQEEQETGETFIPKQAEPPQTEMGSLPNNDPLTEDVNESRTTDRDEEASERTMTPNTEAEKREETVTEVEVNKEDNKVQNAEECDLEEGHGEMEMHIIAENDVKGEDNVNKNEAGSRGRDVVGNRASGLWSSPEDNKSDEGEGNESRLPTSEQLSENKADVQGDPNVGQRVPHRSGRDEDEDEGVEVVEVSALQEREQYGQHDTDEPAHTPTADEIPDQDEGSLTDTGGRRGKESLPECVVCSEEVSQHTELHTEEEQEDVAEVTRTKISHDVCLTATTARVLLNDTRWQEDPRSSEEGDKGGTSEISHAPTSVTVKPEAETPQETSGELENVPPRMSEGRAAVSPGLHSAEETQEGVPEYNNEPGPDGNTSQTFLEVGDGKQIQTTQLPEEVGSLHNSGCEDLLGKGQRREEQQSTGHRGAPHGDVGLLQDRVKPFVEQVIEKSRLLLEHEEGNILLRSMETGIEHSQKEFETSAILAGDTTAELRHKTEELFDELEVGERLSGSRDAGGDGPGSAGPVAAGAAFKFADGTSSPPDAELLNTMNRGDFQESSDENCNVISSPVEDNTEAGFLKALDEGEPEAHRDWTAEVQDGVRGEEGTGHGPEEGAEQDEMENKIPVEFLDVDVTAEPIKEKAINQSALPTGLDKAFEISNGEMLKDTGETDELIISELPSDISLTVTSEEGRRGAEQSNAGETSSGHGGVIDEEILDLWIQAASSEDTDQITQQAGHEQQADTKTHEEAPEMSSGMGNELLTESEAGESGLVRDTEMPSLTADSGILDQPLKLSGTESYQDNHDMLAVMSETAGMSDLCKQQTVAECHDAAGAEQSDLKEEESIAEPGFNSDSGVLSSEAGHQELHTSRDDGSSGEHTELVENDTGSQKDSDARRTDQNNKNDWKLTEEAVAELQRNGASIEETDAEVLPNDTKHPKSGSEFRESSSEIDTWAQSEADVSSLDFTAQRSRIALKNRRTRRPKNPRSLLHMPSLEPTPAAHLQARVPAGVPLGGLGVGIKLPGLGAGFPLLKKTHVVTNENSSEKSREPETKTDDTTVVPKQDEVQKRPKWMPPKHPGLGNPLMSELKNKLKKTTE